MNPEDLGTYYESILDKESRKEDGVYYTPPLIVEYMVANSVGELLKNKTPADDVKLKIVDPACGGGIFLVEAYQFLLDRHEKHFGKLTSAKRRKILTDNIFGIDIDPLAVEITKYCLAMMCSEGKDYSLDIGKNIRCGDSLMDTDFDGQFDIVIGNPPYVEAKKLKKIAVNLKHYDVYSGTADLSVYFIEKGLNLLKRNGLLMFITTNKFFNTGYGKLVRKKILEHQIRNIIDFEQVRAFESALISSVIIGIEKHAPSKDEFVYRKFYKLNNKEFKTQFLGKKTKFGTYRQSLLDANEWSFSDNTKLELKSKIEKAGKKLSKVRGVAVYRGVTTGYNPAFIIDETKKNELIAADSNNANIIKPLLQGRNIRKWVYSKSDEFLLFIPWHFPLHLDDTISGRSTVVEKAFRKTYPTLYNHLRQHKGDLLNRNREETSVRYEWYALQRFAASYYPEFEKPEKIIWGLTADKWAFAYDDGQHYLPSNGYILTSNKIPIKYLLGLLNSNLLKFYFGFIGVMTAGGAFTLKYTTIQQLPIVIADDPQQIISLVDKILAAKKKNPSADTTALEQKIDSFVYKLYSLTKEEIAIVEGNV